MSTLIISRRIDESFTIGSDITVTVLDVRGGSVRISIEAPIDTPILRDDARNTRPRTDRLNPRNGEGND